MSPLFIAAFSSVATLMSIFSIYLISLVKKGADGIQLYLVLYLSGSMLVMFLSLAVYFSYPGIGGIIAISLNLVYMVAGLIPLIRSVMSEVSIVKRSWLSIGIFAALMVISEAAMGEAIEAFQYHSVGNLLLGIETPWFLAVMIPEMLFTLLYGRSKIGRPLQSYLIVTFLILSIYPSLFPFSHEFVSAGIWSTSSLMIAATILIYETLYRSRVRKTQETMTTLEIMIIFTLMMSGEFYYFLYDSWYIFDFSMIAGMIWFMYRSIAGPSHIKGNYLRNTKWTLSFVVMTFIMEWFMGGVLDFQTGIFRSGISGFISSLAIGYISPLSHYGGGFFYDLISLFGSVTGSEWFLIMMGTEMGMLALFKLISSRNRENRVRLALMISAYAIYTIFIPYFSPISSDIGRIPYMWSMGIGTLGPVTPGDLLLGIIGTYSVSAIASVMFGSRQVCSVTCTAPLMYQGTFYDSLKTYNRSSRLGRKTLGSKLRPWYMAIAISVWAILLSAAVISYLNYVGLIKFTIFGTDITYFLYVVYFDLIWYIVFISIPIMGSYACVTQGWCSWGLFNQFFSRLGFFRLKVKDANQCLTCKTKDCALACPVGNTDLPGKFIKSGEFRSSRCIGVGDCVEACPYDNIFFYDSRKFFGDIIRRKKRQ